MPGIIPGLFAAANRALFGVPAKAAKGIAGVGANALWNTLTRTADYALNYDFPTQFPGFDDLLQAHYNGIIDYDQLAWSAQWNAVNLRDGGISNSENDRKYWEYIISSNAPTFDPTTAKQLWLRYGWPDDKLYWHCQRNGIADKIMFEEFKNYSERPDVLDTISLWLRQIISEKKFRELMRGLGWQETEYQTYLMQLAEGPPTPSDIIAMAVKDAWDQGAVKRFGYNEEFPPEFQLWGKRVGLGGDARTDAQKEAGDPLTTWAQMYWRAHWQTIAPTLAYQFRHRARGNPADPATWRIPGLRPFTSEDLSTVLKINDFAPRFRPYLEAISYNVLAQLRIKQVYNAGIVDRKEVFEYYQDNGYNPRDAERLTKLVEVQVDQARRQRLGLDNVPWIKKAYMLGVLDYRQVRIRLLLAFTKDNVRYNELVKFGEQQQLIEANKIPYVEQTVEQWDLEKKMKVLERRINSVKKAYTRGMLNKIRTIQQLQGLGMSPTRIDEYLRDWDVDLLGNRREANAGQVLRWYRNGLISLPEAQTRLSNLRYMPEDQAPMLSETQRNMRLDLLKSQKLATRTAEQRRKALESQQKALRSAQRQTQADLARHGSPNQLAKWLRKDIIDETNFRRRLSRLGWPEDDIDLLKREVEEEKAAKGKVAPARPKPPVAKAGPKVSQARLAKWVKLGLLTLPQYRERLEGLGYGRDDIQRYIDEFAEQPAPRPEAGEAGAQAQSGSVL